MSEPTSPPSQRGGDPDLEAGQVVGEYQVESKLGQGGFGAVFKAVHPLIGKVVAIKVLSRKFSADPEMVSRFVAEAKAVNQIRNRHIIDIFSFGQLADGRHYYVMEYLDGAPLDKLLDRLRTPSGSAARPGEAGACDRSGRLPLGEALPILRAIARALDAAHAKGIAHRDLKPENVFLANDPDGGGAGVWPKLLDFGIAKLMIGEDAGKHKTRTGVPIGTPYYMSPEQCRGKDVDHRTDFYAFGIVAFQMLTGKHPIDGEDFMAILMNQISQEPPPASSIAPELPPAVDDVIAWLMQKDPAQRPPSLAAAMAALEAAAEQAGIAFPRAAASAPLTAVGKAPTAPGRAGVAMATTMPSGAGITDQAGLGPRASGLRPGVIVAAIAGAAVIGAVVFFVLTRGGGEQQGAPVVAAPPPPAQHPGATPTPPPPPPPPAVTIDAAPATVQITIAGAPDGTEVLLDRHKVATTPGPIALPRDGKQLELELRHAGYVTAKREVVPDRDQELTVKLRRMPAQHAPQGSAKPTGHDSLDIEDPFQH